MSYSYSQGSYLIHYGVGDGQQPGGQERLHGFGTQRFLRGKKYNTEQRQIHAEELKKLQNNSKKYKEAKREAERLNDKYHMNVEYEDEVNSKYSKEDLKRASDRYWNKVEDMSSLDHKFNYMASKKAYDTITQKYGKESINDIKHYHNMKDVNALIIGSGLVSLLAISRIRKRHK